MDINGLRLLEKPTERAVRGGSCFVWGDDGIAVGKTYRVGSALKIRIEVCAFFRFLLLMKSPLFRKVRFSGKKFFFQGQARVKACGDTVIELRSESGSKASMSCDIEFVPFDKNIQILSECLLADPKQKVEKQQRKALFESK